MGMRQMGVELRVVALTSRVIETVVENKKKHIEAVEKAREGYMAKAVALLEEKLRIIRSGKLEQISVSLPLPISHERDYDSIITMLSYHTDSTIELGAQEVQNFLEDKWEWTDHFMMTNQMYLK